MTQALDKRLNALFDEVAAKTAEICSIRDETSLPLDQRAMAHKCLEKARSVVKGKGHKK